MDLQRLATAPEPDRPRRTLRQWRPADVVALIAVMCYGAAALIVAAGLFVRLASHP
jgi:hypothetical protein